MSDRLDEMPAEEELPITDMPMDGSEGPLIPPETVKYRPAENPEQTCGKCQFFVQPGSCQLVSGRIDPAMTCDLWRPLGEEGATDMEADALESQLFGG